VTELPGDSPTSSLVAHRSSLVPSVLSPQSSVLPGGRASRTAVWVIGLLGVLGAIIIGLPQCGANAGGFVTFLVGGVLLAVRIKGNAALWRAWPVLLAAVVGLGAFAVLDLLTGPHTHFGGMLHRLLEQGIRPVLEMAADKAMLSYSTFRNPLMIKSLALGAVGVVLWIGAGRGRLRLLAGAAPTLVRIVPVLALTALVAVLFNDTGVVAGGLIIGVAFFAALYTAAGAFLDAGRAG